MFCRSTKHYLLHLFKKKCITYHLHTKLTYFYKTKELKNDVRRQKCFLK